MKTFEEFTKALKNDETLVNQVAEAKKSVQDVRSRKAMIDLLVKIGQEQGYDVNVEDFTALQAGAKELSEEELALAAGGSGDSGVPGDDCSKNYTCLLNYNNCMFSNECFAGQLSCDYDLYWGDED